MPKWRHSGRRRLHGSLSLRVSGDFNILRFGCRSAKQDNKSFRKGFKGDKSFFKRVSPYPGTYRSMRRLLASRVQQWQKKNTWQNKNTDSCQDQINTGFILQRNVERLE